jgi:putative FmdB family regulatory protein
MPTYEYLCDACQHEFEREQRISDPPVKTCPRCKAQKVKRLISRTSFHLKGGGWYSDLYSKKTAKKDAGAKSDGESKPAPSEGSAKSDSGSGGGGKDSGGKDSGSKAAA